MSKKKRTSKKKHKKSPLEQLASKIRKMASEAIDIYCHGIDATGKKGIEYRPTKEQINEIFSIRSPKKPITNNRHSIQLWQEACKSLSMKKQDISFTSKLVLKHITGKQKQYYCNSQFGKVFWMGWDIDNDTDDLTAIIPWYIFLHYHFPDIWSDSGSSGKSLHCIIRTDMTALHKYYDSLWFDDKKPRTYSKVANSVVYAIAHIVKLYGHKFITPNHKLVINKQGKKNPAYDVELCSIKGSYSDWEGNKNYRKRIITSGTLFKFPNIYTEADYTRFTSAPIYPVIDILTFCIYLSTTLSLSQTLTLEEEKSLSKDVALIEAVLIANGVQLPVIPVVEPVSIQNPITEEEKGEERRKNKSIGPYFGSESVSDGDIGSYDPFTRCRLSVQRIYRILGREPEYEEWNQYYEDNGWNTGDDVDGRRRIRFETVVPFVRAGFDYSKVGGGKYHKPGDNIVDAKAMISTQDLKQWNTKFTKNIDHADIDMMIGYTRSCLNDTDSRADHDKGRWADTIPLRGLEHFWQRRQDEGQIKRSYSHGKATSLMALMLRKVWLIKTANHFAGDANTKGIASKYDMTRLHPYYKEWQEHQAEIKSHRTTSKPLKKKSGVIHQPNKQAITGAYSG